MPTLGQPEIFLQVREGMFGADGRITRPDTREFLQAWVDAYSAWVKKFASI
jgi:chromate reductase